ncbi:hypothetical protein ABPG72_006647 [Tetrahymena utriculariae]
MSSTKQQPNIRPNQTKKLRQLNCIVKFDISSNMYIILQKIIEQHSRRNAKTMSCLMKNRKYKLSLKAKKKIASKSSNGQTLPKSFVAMIPSKEKLSFEKKQQINPIQKKSKTMKNILEIYYIAQETGSKSQLQKLDNQIYMANINSIKYQRKQEDKIILHFQRRSFFAYIFIR